jgi:predicted alpha/beta hydrolase
MRTSYGRWAEWRRSRRLALPAPWEGFPQANEAVRRIRCPIRAIRVRSDDRFSQIIAAGNASWSR